MSTSQPPATNSRYFDVFGRQPVLLPVIHVLSVDQALANIRLAVECGCRGVFLINHDIHISYLDLLLVWRELDETELRVWVGFNFLDLMDQPTTAVDVLPLGAGGIWLDDGQIDEHEPEGPASQVRAGQVLDALDELSPRPLLFGGVAFKGQREVFSLERACQLAAPRMDVVTTSGPRTGFPPSIEKIARMKEALGDHPLALASGVNAHNARSFVAAGVTAFLVASSIVDEDEMLNTATLRELKAVIEG